MDKKARGETAYIETKRKPKVERKPVDDEKQKAKELERARQEGESRRKSHNVNIRVKITKIQKDIEKLQLENYSKCRALSDPHIFRDEETAKDYGRRLKEIEQELLLLDGKIKELEKQIK